MNAVSPVMARVCDLERLEAAGYVIGEMDGSGLRRAYPPAPPVIVRDDAKVAELRTQLAEAIEEISSLKLSLSATKAALRCHMDESAEKHADLCSRLELAANLIEPDPIPNKVTLRFILEAVAARYGVSVFQLTSAQRSQRVARPRQIACWLACQLTGHSLPTIGRFMGNRDHTTVMHARKKINALREAPDFMKQTDELRDRVVREFYGQDGGE